MRAIVVGVVGAIFLNSQVSAQQKCGTVVECAQAAVEVAHAAQTAAERVRNEVEALRRLVTTQEQSNAATRTGFQALITNSNNSAVVGKETISASGQVTQLRCGNGEYLVGVNFHWSGTCHTQCEPDGPILRWVAPVCRKF